MKLWVFFALILMVLMVGCTTTEATVKDEGLRIVGSNAKVNLFPGAKGSGSCLLNNAIAGFPREIRISIAPEDDRDLKGWQQLPEEYYSWFNIEPSEFIMQPGETRQIKVSVKVPEDTDYQGKARCELLVRSWPIVNDKGEVGNVSLGVASEFYIIMR